MATNNYLLLLDRTQEALSTRFSKNEWVAIEMAVVEASDENSAGPSIVDAVEAEFSKNTEIKRLKLDLAKIVKKLNTLTWLERDAITDAGRKSRAFPETRLFDLLGTVAMCD